MDYIEMLQREISGYIFVCVRAKKDVKALIAEVSQVEGGDGRVSAHEMLVKLHKLQLGLKLD